MTYDEKDLDKAIENDNELWIQRLNMEKPRHF